MSLHLGVHEQRQTRHRAKSTWPILVGAGLAAVISLTGCTSSIEDATADSDTNPSTTTLSVPTTTSSVAPQDSEPTASENAAEIAAEFLAAMVAYDGEAARSLLSGDATVMIGPAEDRDDMLAHQDWWEAMAWVFALDSCVGHPAANPNDIHVACSGTHHNAWMAALGNEPIGHGFNLIVRGSKISEVELELGPSFYTDAWGPFERWVSEAHPDEAVVMYEDTLSKASIPLWKKYTEEFVAQQ